jgi:AcrR family transcriptional regulator
MQKLDRRVARTHELLGNALIALIIERGYEELTIKDVTERADVAYVTFFRHYRDLDELLTQRLQAGIEALMDGINEAMQKSSGYVFGEAEGLMIFEYVRVNAPLFRILLNSRAAFLVRKRVQQAIADMILTECPPMLENTAGFPPELIAHHLAAAQISLIEWWLDNGMPYDVAYMAHVYDRLVSAATVNAAGILDPMRS